MSSPHQRAAASAADRSEGSTGVVRSTSVVDARWRERVALAGHVRDQYARALEVASAADDDPAALTFLQGLDATTGIGARHHVVPRFLLDGWAERDQVRVYHRIERRHGLRNIKDLAIKDFYTFIDLKGEKNALLEALLARIEADTAAILRSWTSSFIRPEPATVAQISTLAMFAGFQVVRTPRHRRQSELQADWIAKTLARGRVSDAELERITVVPHQNDAIGRLGNLAMDLAPMFHARPLALVTLDRPMLLIGDDPIVVNPGPGEVHHHPDCMLTDSQVRERAKRNRRRNRRHPERNGRVLHQYSPVPQGIGTAIELILPISPAAALVWGELGDAPEVRVEHDRLRGLDADRFAELVNNAMCERALDWIVTRPGDATFATRTFPDHGPLVKVCDGDSPASAAINATPMRIRPQRLSSPA